MLKPQPFPLHLQERVAIPTSFQRMRDLIIFFLLLSLLSYRLAYFYTAHSQTVWLIASFFESCIAFIWFLNVNARWNPVRYKTYPERLAKRFDDLPGVDMFVTTADPTLEPPLITVNTVLSLLAVEYPANKLACYVSDDGGSSLTYYALSEASKFARLWVPFCKKYNVRVRAPFMYFSTEIDTSQGVVSSEFVQDWMEMKREYQDLSRKIEGADEDSVTNYLAKDEVSEFSAVERGNHPSIIKVMRENKDEAGNIPHLVYVAREKRPKHPHHFKAGAMNVLMRVSGVMTNAPFILNVDCDMFANNPEVILHGMCLLLGFDKEVSSGYVQAPQIFYDALKDDPFGNQFVVTQNKSISGMAGIQGPFYAGTGCFHRRKIIYGSSPESDEIINGQNETMNDNLSYKQLHGIFGNSRELVESVNQIKSKKSLEYQVAIDFSTKVPAAKGVADCTYEHNTSWGQEIGWMYGSLVEDVLTGIQIQAKGWRSVYFTPDPPAFVGSAPTGGPACLTQLKRWGTGHTEVLFAPNGPVAATIYKHLSFRQLLVYLWFDGWAVWGVVEVCYSLIPAYCLLANSSFLPKASSLEFLLPAALFAAYNTSTFIDFRECNLSFSNWWNNQRMNLISSATSFLFGFLAALLKFAGLSESVFEVTRKDQNNSSEGFDLDPRKFTFDSSPLFIPGTALTLVHVAGLAVGAVTLLDGGGKCSWGVGEVVCSVWMVMSFWPFVNGLFRKGSYGIPWSVIWKAVMLCCIFLQVCRLDQVGGSTR